jgi:hypothetical protein
LLVIFNVHYEEDEMKRFRWVGHAAKRHQKCVQNFSRITRRENTIWEYNIKMYLKEIHFKGVSWIQQAQDRIQWFL